MPVAALRRMATQSGKGNHMRSIYARFVKDKSAATAIEYGLIAALVSIAIIGGLTKVGTKLSSNFNNVSAQMK